MDNAENEITTSGMSATQIHEKLLSYIESNENDKFHVLMENISLNDEWDLNQIVNVTQPPLITHAALHNNASIIESLLQAKHVTSKDIDNLDQKNKTALMHACNNNNTQLALLLMNNGSNCNIVVEKTQICSMYYACYNGNLKMIQLLLSKDKFQDNSFNWDEYINIKLSATGYSLFHILCQKGHIDCLDYLLSIENKYTTKIKIFETVSRNDMNGLILACDSNQTEMAKYLIDNVYTEDTIKNGDFDINSVNKLGCTAFWRSSFRGNEELVRYIYEKYKNYVDVNKGNKNGATAFYVAAQNGEYNVLKYLLSLDKIDPNIFKKNTITPLMIAAKDGRDQCVDLCMFFLFFLFFFVVDVFWCLRLVIVETTQSVWVLLACLCIQTTNTLKHNISCC